MPSERARLACHELVKNLRSLSQVRRRDEAASATDLFRRGTCDRVILTKPLAFAADAGELWVLLGRFENLSPAGMPKSRNKWRLVGLSPAVNSIKARAGDRSKCLVSGSKSGQRHRSNRSQQFRSGERDGKPFRRNQVELSAVKVGSRPRRKETALAPWG